jgi:methylenetetrahydrofolate reductase (NADPH)
LENLRRKVAAGGDVVITQLFYDNADFFKFRRRCLEIGLTAPIVPGLLPITNLAQVQRISTLCGARLPAELTAALEAAGDDADAQFELGVDYCKRQTQELIDAGAPGLHFYVLNKSTATCAVLQDVRLPK